MNDIAQFNLAEPPKVDWDNYGKSGFQVPPDALDPAGKPIVYYGTIGKATETDPDEGLEGEPLLNFLLDPIVLEDSGYVIRFTRASVRPYSLAGEDGKRVAKKGNPNKLADALRSTGLQAKPQGNDQYKAAVQQVVSLKKKVGFTINWEAYNKETGESIKGFQAFPVDPTTGHRKAILKAGDFYNVVDQKGNPTGQQAQVKSEVLFANAKVAYFKDPKGAPRA
jgi:hypothetical protein